jgi:predicted nucleic acid-binding protein
VIVLDTSGLLSVLDDRQPLHAACASVVAHARPPLILSPFVLAELDYLVAQVAGQAAELIVLEDVARGAYQLEPFDAANVAAARTVIERYADLRLGLADASIAVLAERYGCLDVLTLDQRHFRSIRGPKGTPFRLLPDDERRPASPTGH